MKKRYVASTVILGGIISLAIYSLPKPPAPVQAAAQNPPVAQVSQSPALPAELPAMGTPHQLLIPTLGITSVIRPVGREPNGDMALPDSLTESGWYNHGAAPGNPGKAVIGAHTGYPHQPSQFRALEKLQTGDTFQVVDQAGTIAHFEVLNHATYRPKEAPLGSIFGDSPTARLVLVTCAGEWNPNTQAYSHRLVIYAVRAK